MAEEVKLALPPVCGIVGSFASTTPVEEAIYKMKSDIIDKSKKSKEYADAIIKCVPEMEELVNLLYETKKTLDTDVRKSLSTTQLDALRLIAFRLRKQEGKCLCLLWIFCCPCSACDTCIWQPYWKERNDKICIIESIICNALDKDWLGCCVEFHVGDHSIR